MPMSSVPSRLWPGSRTWPPLIEQVVRHGHLDPRRQALGGDVLLLGHLRDDEVELAMLAAAAGIVADLDVELLG